jgi:cephalosporin-C deacetylase-like acetyl esterase
MIGKTISHYRIVEKLGEGGMGVVYKAEDRILERMVALKFLPAGLSPDQQEKERFIREAKSASALDHPNIGTIHEIAETEDGQMFIVMTYYEGETLKEKIERGPLPVKEAVDVAVQIAQGLAKAHSRQIVHRDIKPGNLLVTTDGLVKIIDFGLAKLGGLTKITQTHTTMGTVAYISPEQARGEEVDQRSDVWSLGVVLYEMLVGQLPFPGTHAEAIIHAILTAKPLKQLVPEVVPTEIERVIYRALEKDPRSRYASAADILKNLTEYQSSVALPVTGAGWQVISRWIRQKRVAIPGLLFLLLLSSLLGWLFHQQSKVRWARDHALPEIAQLIEQEKLGEAYAVAVQAEKYIADDPMLGKFWPAISWSASIRTTPPGASVFRRNYNVPDGSWEFIGRSPIEKYRVPSVDFQWRFELKGFAVAERSTVLWWEEILPSSTLSVTLDEEAKAPAGMVHVSLQNEPATLFGLPGFEDLPEILLEDYWLDRYEVTNRQFQDFVDHGGYQKQKYWKHEFRKDGRTLSWGEAMALFRDATGRPGPSTWEQGEYPRDQGEFPVSGVSWYEAAAYSEFTGKTLPTIYHWASAASAEAGASIVPASNLGGRGPARVASHRSMSWFGIYDMAGNVKEWCWNEAGFGRRYILGGAWDEPVYMFNNPDARSPFDRSANLGFRCAKYSPAAAVGKAADPVTRPARDFNLEKPVSDELFRVYKSLYSYDKTPLHATVDSVDEEDDWKREKITFAAVYGNERVIAYLFLPKKSQPPFQTVVCFPTAGAIGRRSSATTPYRGDIDFVIKSGRAVMYPVYKGTYERGDDLKSHYPNTTSSWRDHVIAWSKDLGRSIDYLVTRPEIDRNKLAYEGISWGGVMGSILPAVEDRIKVCVLIVPGFHLQKSLPEVDELNFAPRVKVPVLMLNGRFDFIFPVETSQLPMFRLLGTPKEHKRRVVYETGHNIPRHELIKETIDWLDRYLGPVNRREQ